MTEAANPRTEHAARIAPPEEFREDSFRRKRIAPGVTLVLGKRGRERATSTQSIRFAADQFTPGQARAWLERQGYRPTAFEAANAAPRPYPWTIDLDEDELRGLRFIAQNYLYADVLAKHLHPLDVDPATGAGTFGLHESEGWEFDQALEDEGGFMALAGGTLKRKLEELLEAIHDERPEHVNPGERCNDEVNENPLDVDEAKAIADAHATGQHAAIVVADSQRIVFRGGARRYTPAEFRRQAHSFAAQRGGRVKVVRLYPGKVKRNGPEAGNPDGARREATLRSAPVQLVDRVAVDLARIASRLQSDIYPESAVGRGVYVEAARSLVEAASATVRASTLEDPFELLGVARFKIDRARDQVPHLALQHNPSPAANPSPAPAENPRELVQIGIARQLDLEDGTRFRWTVAEGWPVLVEAGAESAEAGRARVYLVSPGTRGAPGPAGDVGERAARTFSTWHGFDARKSYQLDVPAPGEFKACGRAVQIVYRSDKWEGRPVDYVHDFKRSDPPDVLCCGAADSPRAMMLRGGQLRVTRRGLVH